MQWLKETAGGGSLINQSHTRIAVDSVDRLERSLIVERVRAGLRNGRAKGKRLGRPRAVVDAARIGHLRSQGRAVREIADELGVSRSLVHKTLANRALIDVARTGGWRPVEFVPKTDVFESGSNRRPECFRCRMVPCAVLAEACGSRRQPVDSQSNAGKPMPLFRWRWSRSVLFSTLHGIGR